MPSRHHLITLAFLSIFCWPVTLVILALLVMLLRLPYVLWRELVFVLNNLQYLF